MSQTLVVSCPGCATRFGAPVEQFVPAGRQVRCSRCKHVWFHPSPHRKRRASPNRAAPVAPRRPGPLERETPTAQRIADASVMGDDPASGAGRVPLTGRRGGGGALAWFLWAVALVLLLAILAYVLREPLRRTLPGAAPLLDRYADTVDRTARGLVGRRGGDIPFEFRNIHYDVHEYDGDKQILVEADLLNITSREMPAPNVKVRVVDADRAPLHASVIGPEDESETIAAGTNTHYFVRILDPPSDFDAVLLHVEEPRR